MSPSNKKPNLRAELVDEMLDLEKTEFTQRMNFNVIIPTRLVKLSNTYYAKLSTLARNFLNDGHS